MNKKVSAIACRLFRHIHQYLLVATRVLSWNQTRPCGKATTIFKFSSFANRGNNSRGCFRTNTFNFGNPLAGF
ncbi:hypothetical protein AS299_04690 [Citrobacter freundii]|nr:hypothetical protein ABR34_01270 [Citrobacter braakii]OCF81577.1 hypothetical protein AS299_04690 [Citrobacter freundii]